MDSDLIQGMPPRWITHVVPMFACSECGTLLIADKVFFAIPWIRIKRLSIPLLVDPKHLTHSCEKGKFPYVFTAFVVETRCRQKLSCVTLVEARRLKRDCLMRGLYSHCSLTQFLLYKLIKFSTLGYFFI